MRAATHCVPFGLFSTYSILSGEAQEDASYQQFSNLDMSFLSAALQMLNREETVRHKLLYRFNDTAYALGENYR